MTELAEVKIKPAARILHSTAFWVHEIQDDAWQAIEAAGQISLSEEHRTEIQAACSRCQELRAMTEASASPAKVKAFLEKLSTALNAVQVLLQEMHSGSHEAQSASFMFRQAFRPDRAPNHEEMSEFGCQVMEWSILANRAGSKIVTGAENGVEARGRRNTRFNYDLLDKLESIFKSAGGRKKLRVQFLEAVQQAIGFKIVTGTEALRRGGDKARRRKSSAVPNSST